MLIQGGTLHTMTAQGVVHADIRIEENRIVEVGEDLPAQGESCVLDARGLTIMPGAIDAFIQDGPETDAAVLSSGHASGVTAGLVWPEREGRCTLLTVEGLKQTSIHAIHPEDYTDAGLHGRFIDIANEGGRVACEVWNEKTCRRVLQVVHSTRVKAILAHLSGCEEMLEAVVLAGCPAVLGGGRGRQPAPWEIAARLDALGGDVSLSCCYPNAKLRHLPLCAGLCVRAGMERNRALQKITTGPAALLGLKDVGKIASGCRADLAIFDGEPLLLATAHVMTVAAGKIRH